MNSLFFSFFFKYLVKNIERSHFFNISYYFLKVFLLFCYFNITFNIIFMYN